LRQETARRPSSGVAHAAAASQARLPSRPIRFDSHSGRSASVTSGAAGRCRASSPPACGPRPSAARRCLSRSPPQDQGPSPSPDPSAGTSARPSAGSSIPSFGGDFGPSFGGSLRPARPQPLTAANDTRRRLAHLRLGVRQKPFPLPAAPAYPSGSGRASHRLVMSPPSVNSRASVATSLSPAPPGSARPRAESFTSQSAVGLGEASRLRQRQRVGRGPVGQRLHRGPAPPAGRRCGRAAPAPGPPRPGDPPQPAFLASPSQRPQFGLRPASGRPDPCPGRPAPCSDPSS